MSILKGGEDLLSKTDDTYSSAFLGADLELDSSRRREISLYKNNEVVLTIEYGVTLGLLKLVYSSDSKFHGTLQGVRCRNNMDQSPISSVILSDDRVLNQDEYDLIVQDHQLPSTFMQHNLGPSIQPLQQQQNASSSNSIPLPPPPNNSMFMTNINSNPEKKFGQFVCEFCHLPFVSKAKFLRHRRIHTEENPYACVYCTETFSHHLELRKHREERHMTNKSFKCTFCTKTFSTRAELKSHMWRHTGEKNHKCRICSKMFATKGNLKLHIDKHIGVHKHKCPFCPQRFTSHSSLEAHMAKHTGMRSYKCRFCTKTYAQSGQLTAHERLHTGEKPFTCQVCAKEFRLNSTRLAHEKRHSGARPHICDTCGRSFSMPEHLKRHLKTHESKLDRLVACPFCKKKIFAGRNMKKHIIRHRELNLTEIQAKAISSSLKPDREMNERDALDEDQRSNLSSGKSVLRQVIRCSECNEEVKSMRKLLEHLTDVHYQRELTTIERKEIRIRHGLQKLHHCQLCTSYFVDYRLFRSHVVTEHPDHAEYLGFAGKNGRKNNAHSTNNTHKCPNCSLLFHQRSALDEHILKDHLPSVVDAIESCDSLQFRCWYCPQHFLNPEEVVSHMTNEHESLDVLSKRVEMTDVTGENDVSSSGLWACPHCSVNVKSEEEYTAHLTLHISSRQPGVESSTIVRPRQNNGLTTIIEAQSIDDSLKNNNNECVIKKYLNLNQVSVEKSNDSIESDVNNSLTISSTAQSPPIKDAVDLKIETETLADNISECPSECPDEPVDTMALNDTIKIQPMATGFTDIESNEPGLEIVLEYESESRSPKKKKSKKKKHKKRKQKFMIEVNSAESCRFCSDVFSDKAELFHHVRVAHGADKNSIPFRCWFCAIAFSSPEDAVNHMTNEHDNLDNLSRRIEMTECKNQLSTDIIDSCRLTLLNSEGANDASLSPVNSLTCPLCPKKLESKEAYELHVMVHEAARNVDLNKIRADRNSLSSNSIDDVPLSSEHMEMETVTASSTFTAISTHFDFPKNSIPKVSIECAETKCTDTVNKAVVLCKDKAKVSKVPTLKVKSKVLKNSVTQTYLANSRLTDNNASNVSVNRCTHCSRAFCGKKALDVHTLKMHGKEFLQKLSALKSSPTFSCWFCSANFTSPELVVDHMTIAHENLDRLSKRIEEQEMPSVLNPSNVLLNNTNISISTAFINNSDKSQVLRKHISIAPQKTVVPLPPNVSACAVASSIPNIADGHTHQPPPGFKVSYALAYVPIFVPEKTENEAEKKS